MKTIRNRKGSTAERPFYRLHEIDRICERALKEVALLPDTPQPIRVDRFVEKYFKVSVMYDTTLPDGVLGYTEFGRDGVTGVYVNQILDDEGSKVAERRIRSTVAHEGGHGLLHAQIFAMGDVPASMFGGQSDGPHIMCRDIQGEAEGSGYDGRWWEYQANRAIGGLLLPTGLLRSAMEPFCEQFGILEIQVLQENERERAAREIAKTFDVNPIVARIRIDGLYRTSNTG